MARRRAKFKADNPPEAKEPKLEEPKAEMLEGPIAMEPIEMEPKAEASAEAVDAAMEMLKPEAPAAEPEEVDDGLPKLGQLMSDGFTHDEGKMIIGGLRLTMRGPSKEPLTKAPAYRIMCPREIGMWRTGRQFTQEPRIVLVSELTDAECLILEAQDPVHLKVEKLNF